MTAFRKPWVCCCGPDDGGPDGRTGTVSRAKGIPRHTPQSIRKGDAMIFCKSCRSLRPLFSITPQWWAQHPGLPKGSNDSGASKSRHREVLERFSLGVYGLGFRNLEV